MDHRTAPRPLAVALLSSIALLACSLPGYAQSAPRLASIRPDTDAADFSTLTRPEAAPDVLALPLPTAATAPDSASAASDLDALPDAPQTAQTPSTPATDQKIAQSNTGQQTKRILFIIPNFRAVSVDEKLPPLTAKEEIKLVFQDSFDYSSFIYVGITAGIAQWQKSYPEFHQGAAGYGRYYWHAFADSVNENAWTEFLIPYPTREDPRYYTLGRGGFGKRMIYSVSRLAITRNNDANNTVNLSEIVGAGAAAGISNLYYPSKYSTWTKTGQKWLLQIAIDGIGNVAKEFWPDINAGVFKNKF